MIARDKDIEMSGTAEITNCSRGGKFITMKTAGLTFDRICLKYSGARYVNTMHTPHCTTLLHT